jgi:hypothetical protein
MKRFTNREQIIKLIDLYSTENTAFAGKIGDIEFLSSRLVGTCEHTRIPELRDQVESMKRKLSWRETRLKNLGKKLAEFDTLMLPGVGDIDGSIPTS